jgi:uncharacterized protein YjbI with pentapeptide repeats
MISRNRQGLRKFSADLIYKARDDTATQVNLLLLTFVGTAAFCVLSLFSPDSALLGGSEKINVPLAGPVSFFGFMLLGPAVLIVVRVYLQIYVDHGERLDRIARQMPVTRAPTLVPLKNVPIRLFSGFALYLLLPLTMLFFAWKAAVYPVWGSGLLGLAVGVITSHAMLLLRKGSWPSRELGSMAIAIMAGVLAFDAHLRRPFDLFRANLSGQFLRGDDFGGADLSRANLSGADLSVANLRGADLSIANLSGANLSGANLGGANLNVANLSTADLGGANLTGVDLSGATLRYTKLGGVNLTATDLSRVNLSYADLSGANLSGANLGGVSLGGSDLRTANLGGANLTGVDLTGANLTGVNLSGAVLSGAHLNSAPLMVGFVRGGAILNGANLSTANLSGANLSGAVLNGANLSHADLSDSKLDGPQLSEACGTDAKLPSGWPRLKPC